MPRTVTIEKTIFAFDELDDRAKERARDWWRECENMDCDTSCTYEDAATIADMLGINLRTRAAKLMGGGTRYEPCIYYSGFSSQGDGACFEGRYHYAKGSVAKIKAHAPQDAELHRIAVELQDIQQRNFYQLSAKMEHRGHYYHSGCMDVEVYKDGNYADAYTEETVKQLMRDFADWIYKQLEAEYWFTMSDENVDESIRCNEYQFDEDGRIA